MLKVFPTLSEMYPGVDHIRTNKRGIPIIRYIFSFSLISLFPFPLNVLLSYHCTFRYHGSQFSFDLSADTTAYQNTLLLRKYVQAYPFLLPLLLVIVKWGRAHGVIEHGISAKINQFGLVWMFLSFCIDTDIISQVTH